MHRLNLVRTTALLTVLAIPIGAAHAQDAIRIGAVLSMTGPAGYSGDPQAKTLNAEVKALNDSGGLLGRQIELVIYDDAADASTARTFATRLVEDDGIVAVIGGSLTGTTMAIMPVVEEAELPQISLAGALQIVEPVRPYVFKTPHTDRMACQKIFIDMQANGISGVGLISGTDGFGASMRQQCIDVAADYDITIVADENYGPNDIDMTPQLNRIKNTAGLDAVLNPGLGTGPVTVTRNFRQLAINVPLYHGHGVTTQSFVDLVGEAGDGVRMPAPALLVPDQLPDGSPQKDVVDAYVARYTSVYNEPVSAFGGYAHDALLILTSAIAAAGSTEPSSIRDAMEATTGVVGVTGEFNMTVEDHMGLDPSAFIMVEIRDGKWLIVDTPAQ
ncbi:ABC transporter substrate-binding protein [Aliihoeflea sp. 2WW]|uniref:ABC transporter substrate-binding protein n=1 Tax=Aliihoeflea sp. 2WW TaxID=1381123 RepID=UPI0004A30218|nr:ABC transporter substrate-binding protein [Aliihoeflea sp. 2WW]